MTCRQANIQEYNLFGSCVSCKKTQDLTQLELADKLGRSVGCLNYCFNALIDQGLVKMQSFSYSKNKFKYLYLLSPIGIAEKVALTTRFLGHKIEEYEALKLEIEALRPEVDASGQDKTQKA